MNHDPLCPWRPRANISAGIEAIWYCQCELIAKARADERATILTEHLPVDYWICGECGNKYLGSIRYCPNSLSSDHRLTTSHNQESPQ